jgi:hypothetical protein
MIIFGGSIRAGSLSSSFFFFEQIIVGFRFWSAARFTGV